MAGPKIFTNISFKFVFLFLKGYAVTKFRVIYPSLSLRIYLNNSAKIYFSHPDSLIKQERA